MDGFYKYKKNIHTIKHIDGAQISRPHDCNILHDFDSIFYCF